MKLDITLEFYHKNAVYNSRITKARQQIGIRKVEIEILNTWLLSDGKVCHCTITSDKGIEYNLSELSFPVPLKS